MEMNKRLILLMANDLLLAFLSIITAYTIRFRAFPGVDDMVEMGMVKLILYVVILMLVSFFAEIYKYSRDSSNLETASRIILSLGFSYLLLSALYYTAPFLSPISLQARPRW